MSLVPARYNFTIYPNATFYKRVFYELEGAVVDLTECEVWLEIKDEPDGKLLYKFQENIDEGVTLGGVSGTIDLKMNAGVTGEITWTSGVYEMFLRDLSIERTDVLLRGGFKVVPF